MLCIFGYVSPHLAIPARIAVYLQCRCTTFHRERSQLCLLHDTNCVLCFKKYAEGRPGYVLRVNLYSQCRPAIQMHVKLGLLTCLKPSMALHSPQSSPDNAPQPAATDGMGHGMRVSSAGGSSQRLLHTVPKFESVHAQLIAFQQEYFALKQESESLRTRLAVYEQQQPQQRHLISSTNSLLEPGGHVPAGTALPGTGEAVFTAARALAKLLETQPAHTADQDGLISMHTAPCQPAADADSIQHSSSSTDHQSGYMAVQLQQYKQYLAEAQAEIEQLEAQAVQHKRRQQADAIQAGQHAAPIRDKDHTQLKQQLAAAAVQQQQLTAAQAAASTSAKELAMLRAEFKRADALHTEQLAAAKEQLLAAKEQVVAAKGELKKGEVSHAEESAELWSELESVKEQLTAAKAAERSAVADAKRARAAEAACKKDMAEVSD